MKTERENHIKPISEEKILKGVQEAYNLGYKHGREKKSIWFFSGLIIGYGTAFSIAYVMVKKQLFLD